MMHEMHGEKKMKHTTFEEMHKQSMTDGKDGEEKKGNPGPKPGTRAKSQKKSKK